MHGVIVFSNSVAIIVLCSFVLDCFVFGCLLNIAVLLFDCFWSI